MARTRAEWHDRAPPFTLGHEIAGWVTDIGQGVFGFKLGESVAVLPQWDSCGRCGPCRRGEENACYHSLRMVGAGAGFDGGLAEYVVVGARFAVPIGDFDPVLAAPLTDAGVTTYSAIKPVLPMLFPGTTAAVIGVGGLGLLAIQMLGALCSARIIAVDQDQGRLDLAREHGADVMLVADETTAVQIRETTAGVGVNFVLDCVGTEATLRTGIHALACLGRLTRFGAGHETVPFGIHDIPWGAQLTTSLNGGTVNLREVVELTRLGRIRVLENRYPLTHVDKAFHDLREGKLRGRAVFIPGT
jgi:propanol-preferring alcohol dehydrogenase